MEDHEPGTPGDPRPGSDTTPPKPAATRSQSVVHYVDRDHHAAARLVGGLMDRAGPAGSTPAFLVIVPTPDDAIALNEALVADRAPGQRALVPLTSVARGRRQLSGGAAALAASPQDLAALVQESLVPMAGIETCVLVWPEDILPDERLAAVEAILSELPRGTERVAIASGRSPELDRFLERAMWRARTIEHKRDGGSLSGVHVRVIAAGASERLRVLRAVLDALDPVRTVVVAATAEGEALARVAATVLGGGVEVCRGIPDARCSLAVLFDDAVSAGIPPSLGNLADDVVAIVSPSQVAVLRRLGATVLPFTWSGAAAAARSAQDQLRDEIRGTVVAGAHAPWIAAIEPLLGEMDPVELAAAAAALLDRERRRSKRLAASAQAAVESATRDAPARSEGSSRPGTAARETARREPRPGRPGGPPGGRSERAGGFRDRGAGDRGRHGREETRGRPFRDRGDRQDTGRGERRGPGRPAGRDAGFRGEDRRPPRDRGGAPRDHRGRGDDIERIPRAAREGAEWSERGERLRNSRRPRGARPGERE